MQQALIETNLAQQPHRLTLDSRSRLSITGVLEVESFDDTEILLTSTRTGAASAAAVYRRRAGFGRWERRCDLV